MKRATLISVVSVILQGYVTAVEVDRSGSGVPAEWTQKITWYTEHLYMTGIAQLNENQVVICTQDYASRHYVQATLLTWDGAELIQSPLVKLQNTGHSGCSVTALSPSQALVCYDDDKKFGSHRTVCRTATVSSGTELSFGEVTHASSGDPVKDFNLMAANNLARLADGRVVVCTYLFDHGDMPESRCRVLTVEGETVTSHAPLAMQEDLKVREPSVLPAGDSSVLFCHPVQMDMDWPQNFFGRCRLLHVNADNTISEAYSQDLPEAEGGFGLNMAGPIQGSDRYLSCSCGQPFNSGSCACRIMTVSDSGITEGELLVVKDSGGKHGWYMMNGLSMVGEAAAVWCIPDWNEKEQSKKGKVTCYGLSISGTSVTLDSTFEPEYGVIGSKAFRVGAAEGTEGHLMVIGPDASRRGNSQVHARVYQATFPEAPVDASCPATVELTSAPAEGEKKLKCSCVWE